MGSFLLTIIISVIVSAIFIAVQFKFFNETGKNRDIYQSFFNHLGEYQTIQFQNEDKEISLIHEGNLPNGSDLKQLVSEINEYVRKNVGTTDFSVIQNKTERKLNMRYDEAMARLAFPTYIGLMGTFAGVFVGIIMFLIGFDKDGITDASIQNLLIGVLVSMATSLFGLFLTTRNNYNASISKKKIDEDKNLFYDFIQNELMPTLDVSMVAALNKLHNTVNLFEPSFNRVIDRFQTTFDSCTAAFGERFQQNVEVVSTAVGIMGDNMDKVNDNIEHQEKLLKTLKSRGIIETLERFVEVSDHFKQIMDSLNSFERARRMMLDAANKVTEYQQQYNDSLQIPLEVAAKINDILNRLTNFEQSINNLGTDVARTQLIGNNLVNAVNEQLLAIRKKQKVAEKYKDIADEKLESLFNEQTNLIDEMNAKYKAALDRHMVSYEEQMNSFVEEMEVRRQLFLESIRERITVDQVHEDFSNLAKLNDIEQKLKDLESKLISSQALQQELDKINATLNELKKVASKAASNSKDDGKKDNKDKNDDNSGKSGGGFFGGLFGGGKKD